MVKKLFLLTIVLILGLAGIVFWRQFWQSNLPPGRKTVLLKSDPLTIVSWQDDRELIQLTIPQNAYVQTSRGFGQYRISSLEELGRIQNLGSKLLLETLGELLGVPVDEVETNLNWFDRLQIWRLQKNISQSKTRNFDLAQSRVFSKQILPDKSEVLIPDREKIGRLLAGVFKDSLIVKEGLTVEVLNASGQAGVGVGAGRLINNLGATVIGVKNNPQMIKQCQLYGITEVLKTLTAKKLEKMFKCEIKSDKLEEARSDLQIIIGSGK